MPCAYCTEEIPIGRNVFICRRCRRPYHVDCWSVEMRCLKCRCEEYDSQLMTSNVPALAQDGSAMIMEDINALAGNFLDLKDKVDIAEKASREFVCAVSDTANLWNERALYSFIAFSFSVLGVLGSFWVCIPISVILIILMFLCMRRGVLVGEANSQEFANDPEMFLEKHPELYPKFEKFMHALEALKGNRDDGILRIDE